MTMATKSDEQLETVERLVRRLKKLGVVEDDGK